MLEMFQTKALGPRLFLGRKASLDSPDIAKKLARISDQSLLKNGQEARKEAQKTPQVSSLIFFTHVPDPGKHPTPASNSSPEPRGP